MNYTLTDSVFFPSWVTKNFLTSSFLALLSIAKETVVIIVAHQSSGPVIINKAKYVHITGQIMSECIDEIIDFPKYHQKKI